MGRAARRIRWNRRSLGDREAAAGGADAEAGEDRGPALKDFSGFYLDFLAGAGKVPVDARAGSARATRPGRDEATMTNPGIDRRDSPPHRSRSTAAAPAVRGGPGVAARPSPTIELAKGGASGRAAPTTAPPGGPGKSTLPGRGGQEKSQAGKITPGGAERATAPACDRNPARDVERFSCAPANRSRAVCEHCGGPMKPGRRGEPKRFCSDACRRAAWRARHDPSPPGRASLLASRDGTCGSAGASPSHPANTLPPAPAPAQVRTLASPDTEGSPR